MLEFKNVSGIDKGFNLKNISFFLESGFVMGIAGKNGAGKSTLFRYILDKLGKSDSYVYKLIC